MVIEDRSFLYAQIEERGGTIRVGIAAGTYINGAVGYTAYDYHLVDTGYTSVLSFV